MMVGWTTSVPHCTHPKRCLKILAVAAASIFLYAHHLSIYMVPNLTSEHLAVSSEDLTAYTLPNSFTKDPTHLTPIDPSMLIGIGTESIDAAHRKGILHTGGILYVMDADGRFLLMKRSSSVVTCPNTWSIVGEHSIVGENAKNLPVRALDEELGIIAPAIDVKIQSLTDHPLFYIRKYGARNGNRIDRQLTYLWLVKLPSRQEDLDWKLDHEVADKKWITLDEFDQWLGEDEKNDATNETNEEDDGPPNGDFCHQTIRALLRLGIEQIKTIL